jgi:hypothetical protein
MKLIRISLAAVLALAVGATVPAFAQHDHDGDAKHDRDKDDKKARGHEDHGRHEGQVRHEEHERHEAQERHEAHERHEAEERHEAHERHEAEMRHEAREREHERHMAYVEHRRIEEANWHAHFGREHRFIYHPVIVEGRPRFHYGGYWFVVARPLPPGWRYTDEVYVDYIDGGYVMCSPVHPGVHISINIL